MTKDASYGKNNSKKKSKENKKVTSFPNWKQISKTKTLTTVDIIQGFSRQNDIKTAVVYLHFGLNCATQKGSEQNHIFNDSSGRRRNKFVITWACYAAMIGYFETKPAAYLF